MIFKHRSVCIFRITNPEDVKIEVKEGDQYPAVINDTRMIGDEINISFKVTEIISGVYKNMLNVACFANPDVFR